MDANLINVSNIQVFFNNMLKNKLSQNIFFSMPNSVKETWKDMVFVDISVSDLGGYGRGFANIFLYAKSLPNGQENVKALSSLEKKLNEIIDLNKDVHYHIGRTGSYSDFDERRKLSCRIVTTNIKIV